MPAQHGVFTVPYSSSHKSRELFDSAMSSYSHAGPSRIHDDGKSKKRKELSGKLGKEMSERRDDGRQYGETISHLQQVALQLSTRPETYPMFRLRLLPLSIERSAILAALEMEERHSLDAAQTEFDEESDKVDEEFKRGRDKVRERLLEGIEERRKRAREEKEGEGTVGDASLDSQTRSHITRKLRNKLGGGTSPPPTPSGSNGHGTGSAAGVNIGAAITTGPFHNPHSLSVDDIPSRFPLPLTASSAGTGTGANGPGNSGATGNPSGRRRGKGGGTHTARTEGALGKSLAHLTGCKEVEIEGDLVEIRRGSKRRRVAAGSIGRMIS